VESLKEAGLWLPSLRMKLNESGNKLVRLGTLTLTPSQVVGAVSGGVDSTIAAKLMSLAIGDRFVDVLL
jgi:GMP synthase PP-ATPase subunit